MCRCNYEVTPSIICERSNDYGRTPYIYPAACFPHIPSIIRAIDKTEPVPPEIPRRRRGKFFLPCSFDARVKVKVKAPI